MTEMKDRLTKKEVQRANFIWYRKMLTVFGMERLQQPGMVLMLIPLMEHYYKDNKEKRIEIMKRHSVFFNTEPATGACIPGIVLSLEEERANGAEITDEFIQNIKVGLMGPFAGIGDALNQSTIPPIMKSIAISIAAGSSPAGAIFFMLYSLIYPYLWSTLWFNNGYNLGTKAADLILGDQMAKIQESMSIVGLMVAGSLSAGFVNVPLKLVFQSEYATVDVNKIINGLFPKLLSVLLIFLGWWLMGKKGWNPIKLMITYLIAVAVLCAIGVL